jgi:pimeloyl-ACP methyl ester carboxylesterase
MKKILLATILAILIIPSLTPFFQSNVSAQTSTNYGPVLWDGEKFISIPENFQLSEGKKTLVVVHGIFSNVDKAFSRSDGTSCINEIMSRGHYDRVVGFNYDYTKKIEDNGDALASFLNQFQNNQASVDIEAHSMGAVVSMDAALKTSVHVNNMVLLGGPIDGTPITELLLTKIIANSGSMMGDISSDINDIQRMKKSGVIEELQPNSFFTNSLKQSVISNLGTTNFVRVVGEKQFFLGETYLFFNGQPNDGVIPVSSARGDGLPGPPPLYFQLSHTEITCDENVIKDVALKLKQTQLSLCPSDHPNYNTANGKCYSCDSGHPYWYNNLCHQCSVDYSYLHSDGKCYNEPECGVGDLSNYPYWNPSKGECWSTPCVDPNFPYYNSDTGKCYKCGGDYPYYNTADGKCHSCSANYPYWYNNLCHTCPSGYPYKHSDGKCWNVPEQPQCPAGYPYYNSADGKCYETPCFNPNYPYYHSDGKCWNVLERGGGGGGGGGSCSALSRHICEYEASAGLATPSCCTECGICQ